MVSTRYERVHIAGHALHLPPQARSSLEVEGRLGTTYERLDLTPGTLERLSGVSARRLWEQGGAPSSGATTAAREALARAGIAPKEIGLLLNCSVTRDYFEPATASLVHAGLGLSESCLAFDISNACAGFSNGLMVAAEQIERGSVRAALVVSCESVAPLFESTYALIDERADLTRAELLRLLPTFTLGCGAAAFVLAGPGLAGPGRRILGLVGRSATSKNDLCVSNGDFFFHQRLGRWALMETRAAEIMEAAAQLGGDTWQELAALVGWRAEQVDRVLCHQVGKQVNPAFAARIGLDFERFHFIYPQLGNLVSAAVPAAFTSSVEAREPAKGEHLVLLGFGSGLHALFTAIEW